MKKSIQAILTAAMAIALSTALLADDGHRTVKERSTPSYPELAKRMNVSGTVKVEVEVSATGSVKSAKAIGGHPLLIEAAVSAAKKFRYEAGSESTETITFNFNPGN